MLAYEFSTWAGYAYSVMRSSHTFLICYFISDKFRFGLKLVLVSLGASETYFIPLLKFCIDLLHLSLDRSSLQHVSFQISEGFEYSWGECQNGDNEWGFLWNPFSSQDYASSFIFVSHSNLSLGSLAL